MTDEQAFRAVAASLMLFAAPVGVYHRLRASRLGAPVTRGDEPWPIRIPLRLTGLAGMALFVTWLVRPDLVAWGRLPFPAWLRWAGVAPAVLAVPLLAWTFPTLGHNLTDTVATRANSYLVTRGPYRWVRHPFYVTVTLFLLGLTLLAALWPCFVAMAIVLTLLAVRTPIEERKLEERFGADYRDYAARTGRYIPRLGGRGGSTGRVVTPEG